MADIKNGHLEVPKDMTKTLKSLKQQGSKKEFLKVAHQLAAASYQRQALKTIPEYNHVVFLDADSNFPRKGITETRVSAGKNLLTIYDLEQHKPYRFPVTRMRCWKVADLPSCSYLHVVKLHGSVKSGFRLSFQFLRGKDKFMWIT